MYVVINKSTGVGTEFTTNQFFDFVKGTGKQDYDRYEVIQIRSEVDRQHVQEKLAKYAAMANLLNTVKDLETPQIIKLLDFLGSNDQYYAKLVKCSIK